MFRRNGKEKSRGQTALEYMLVVGVIVVGAILTAKFFFSGGTESAAGKLMGSAITEASKTVVGDGK